MADNTISSVVRTAGSATGNTLVQEWLVQQLLEEQEFIMPLANSKYSDDKSIPIEMGQWGKFTRRGKLRLPEVATENADPLSSASLPYEQILIPIEWLNDYTAISTMATQTSWLDLAKDFKDLTFEAVKRYQNRAVQAAFLEGRMLPGKRNSSGAYVGDGDSTYPTAFATAAPTVTLYGNSFTFQKAPRYYAQRATNWTGFNTGAKKYASVDDFRYMRVALRMSGTKPVVDGKYVAVVSEAMQADLERDSEYRDAVIRNQAKSNQYFNGQICDFAGFIFIAEDEPWILSSSSSTKLDITGDIHVAQVFGKNAFGHLKLGGKNTSMPQFKVQDITKVGSSTTMGYMFPFQAAILNPAWCANYIANVRDTVINNA